MDTADMANGPDTSGTSDTKDTLETSGPVEHVGTNDPNSFTLVSGVYRERGPAEQAVQALKEAGFLEVQENEYNPNPSEEAAEGIVRETNQRFVVSVVATGRQQEAVGILIRYGSNNSDLPPGTDLVHGRIVSVGEAANTTAEQVASGTNADSLYENAKPLGHPDELKVMDNPNFPRP
jgi:hypothetical protein